MSKKLTCAFAMLSIFIIILVANTGAANELVKGWYDDHDEWFVFEWIEPDGSTGRTIYDPPNKIEPLIESSVSHSQKDGSYTYGYMVSNLGGIQPIYTIRVELFDFVQNATAPSKDWFSMGQFGGDYWDWSLTEREPFGISAGETVAGFSLESRGTPSIVNATFYGHKRVRYNPPGDMTDTDILESFGRVYRQVKGEHKDKYENIILKTIGPTAPPEELVPADFLRNLIEMKHEATRQGWITNPGVERSLDAKLDAALKNVQSGNTKAASNILGAFINEVEAQGCETYDDCPKGKHLSPEAYALLKYNAQYLMDNLR
jgi:hypothetical protein